MKITILLSVYNGERYIRESVDSVLSQSFKDFELIIIDDASTDNTKNIITSYADQRIKIILHKENFGLTRSLNEGLNIAVGKYIARQDAGSISSPERLEMQYAYLEKNPDIFLVGASSVNISAGGGESTVFRAPVSEEKITKLLPKKNVFYHSSIMFRNTKEVLYREKFIYSQDYDLYLSLLSQGKRMRNLPDVLTKYRMLPGSTSFSKVERQFLFSEKAKEFYAQRCRAGKDEYDSFVPENLSVAGPDQEKELLKHGIKTFFKINDFKKVRELYSKYRKLKNTLDLTFIYYISSFLPKSFISLYRKTFSK